MDYKLSHLFDYFDSKPKRYCSRLAFACDFKSISKFKENRDDCHQMIDWFGMRLQELNVEVQLRNVGKERLITGEYIDLPRVIVGKLGEDLTKRTLLVYGHLDVDPEGKTEEWHNDPYDLTEVEGNLIGRGPSDDKGPCVSWLNVIEAFQKLNIPFPMNLKFLFEAHQESGSDGFRSILIDEKHKFLKNVDFIAVSDNYWLGDETPCITYGLRGICYFFIDIECASYDLHSGVYGGCIAEAMSDMVFLMNSLRDYNGRIPIPNFYEDVDKLEREEIDKYYTPINFDCQKAAQKVGASQLLFQTKEENLLCRWRTPWISFHGIEGACDQPGAKCLIPHHIVGKISVRLVPHQSPDKVNKQIVSYLQRLFKRRGSPNRMTVIPFQDGHPFLGDPEDDNYKAARRAVERVWKKKPDLTREGASIPVIPMIQRTLEKSLVMIPIGQGSDKVHFKNEKLRRLNYINGLKVLAAYLFELADIVQPTLEGFSVESITPTPASLYFESRLSHYNS